MNLRNSISKENPLTLFLNERLEARLRGERRALHHDRVELQGALAEIVIIMKELNVPMREDLAELLSKVKFDRGSRR